MSKMSLSYKDVYINVLEYMEIMDTTIPEPRVSFARVHNDLALQKTFRF